MAPAFGAVITTPERRDPTASAVARPVNKVPRATGSDSDAAKRRPLRASASGEQHRMSARIEAERPRPLGLGFTRAGLARRTRPENRFHCFQKRERSRTGTKGISSIAAVRRGHYALDSIR